MLWKMEMNFPVLPCIYYLFLFLQFISDVKLMFKNCLEYNGETSSKTYFARIFSDHNHLVKSSDAPVISVQYTEYYTLNACSRGKQTLSVSLYSDERNINNINTTVVFHAKKSTFCFNTNLENPTF